MCILIDNRGFSTSKILCDAMNLAGAPPHLIYNTWLLSVQEVAYYL